MTRPSTLVILISALVFWAAACAEKGSYESSGGGPGESGSATRPAGGAPKDPADKPAREAPSYKARFQTSKGDFVVEVFEEWAPKGAARFKELIEGGYFTDCIFYRAVPGFMVQFGLNADAAVNASWRTRTIQDDPVKASNTRGMITFAMGGPNTRSTQLFINYADNRNLDGMGFAPIGRVSEGMDVVDSFNKKYGDILGRGHPLAPKLRGILSQGNAYIRQVMPGLDFIKTAEIVK